MNLTNDIQTKIMTIDEPTAETFRRWWFFRVVLPKLIRIMCARYFWRKGLNLDPMAFHIVPTISPMQLLLFRHAVQAPIEIPKPRTLDGVLAWAKMKRVRGNCLYIINDMGCGMSPLVTEHFDPRYLIELRAHHKREGRRECGGHFVCFNSFYFVSFFVL